MVTLAAAISFATSMRRETFDRTAPTVGLRLATASLARRISLQGYNGYKGYRGYKGYNGYKGSEVHGCATLVTLVTLITEVLREAIFHRRSCGPSEPFV